MTDYTPTTETVRERFADGFPRAGYIQALEDFDRWLAAHDAEVLRKAAAEFPCDDEALTMFELALVRSNAGHYLRDRADLIEAAVKREGADQ